MRYTQKAHRPKKEVNTTEYAELIPISWECYARKTGQIDSTD